jgi:hypothetical protein
MNDAVICWLTIVVVCCTISLAWAGEADQARPPAGPAERELALFVERLYLNSAAADIEVRRAAYVSALPGREEFDYLFAANAVILWPRYEKKLERFLRNAPQMKGRSRKRSRIDNILDRVFLVDLSRDKKYAEFQTLIPAGTPVYKAVTHIGPGRDAAVSGPYLRVRGRWFWMQGIDHLPQVLRYLRRGEPESGGVFEDPDAPGSAESLKEPRP